jgi:hypothetical protein
MKKIIFLALLPVLFFQIFTFTPIISLARADGPTDINNQQGFGTGGQIPGAFGAAASAPADPREIAANIIKVVLGLLGVIFVVLLIYAGFKYLTSQGNEDQIDSAKKQILYAVIGLLIILSAYGLTVFILKSVINATNNSAFL